LEAGYIALAIPVFFALIVVEWWVGKRTGRGLYRLNDSLNDLSCGVLQRLAVLLGAGFIFAGYLAIYEHLAISRLSEDSAVVWVACFVGVDFLYYWFHRLSHEVNFMWAAHVVHHQSEEYNLAVALRQSALQPFLSMAFYWPLALVGFPPVVFAACSAINTLYQFWIHTRTIGRLGALESVLMTPSHHRVHHGRNPIYLDRNHGGTFILWDRLFGTFQREEEEVAYGVTKPLATWNPLWANIDYWIDLIELARQTTRVRDQVRIFFERPGWRPDELGGFEAPMPIPTPLTLYDPPLSTRLRSYAALQFIQLLGLLVILLPEAVAKGGGELVLGCLAISWGLLGVGAVLDGRSWAGPCEWLRIVATPLLLVPLLPSAVAIPLSLGFLLNLAAATYFGVNWGGLRANEPS
jgi:sterol desaturase/sphingolipid hydroxylase (fatty acid hydroxylase superfamily)